MKNTNCIIILSIILLTSNNLFSQDVIDKLSRKLCKCAEKQEVNNINEMGPCFEEVLIDNLKDIKEHYNAKTMDDIDMEEIGNKVGAKIIKECPYVTETFPTDIVGNEEKIAKQPDLKCGDLQNGDFYYLTQRPETEAADTTFVTISNDMFLERMKNGRTYSLLNIKWKDDCKFDLIFRESNDPFKKELSSPGDVYEYEILTNGSESLYLQSTWKKRSFQFELIKIE
ncbi:hypothetical protein [Flagellimonas algicola]|uniref:Uncharacterized protein n=1 Tax=Flagellimonas algicola TaxID=2583815 RepID=A0ABY2WI47_9FLAO|nr:hypothetical protein [Allomuricauda algicola]TMU50991.1 hypothetical protein FGG15_17360 [Allomuricauda algicola]